MLNLQNYEKVSLLDEFFGHFFSFQRFTKFLMSTEFENSVNYMAVKEETRKKVPPDDIVMALLNDGP